MKKAFALSMAAAMVLSMSAMAFAASNSGLVDEEDGILPVVQVTPNTMYEYVSANSAGNKMIALDDGVAFGKTIYFALLINEGTEEEPDYKPATDAKSVSGLKVTPKWSDGASYVSGVEIVKKDGAYYVAVSTKGSSLEEINVTGKIYLKGTVGSGEYKEKVDGYFSVDFNLEYGTVTPNGSEKKLFVGDSLKVYDLEDVKYSDYTIYFSPDETAKNAVASVVTDVSNIDSILMGYNVDEVDSLTTIYNVANLDFVALTGTFRKTAEVTIYADEGTYLYKFEDGKISAVDAQYDEWEEGFVFNTRTLGTYVISDVKLDVTAGNTLLGSGSGSATTTTTPSNPNTGAAI
jgi:hypothetical protein